MGFITCTISKKYAMDGENVFNVLTNFRQCYKIIRFNLERQPFGSYMTHRIVTKLRLK